MVGSLISFILVGLAAGWIAGKLLHGEGFGLLGNLVVGVIGSMVGGILFWALGLGAKSFIGSLIVAVIGAFVFLVVSAKLKKT